jgi:glutamate synthase domain-containing protein 3
MSMVELDVPGQQDAQTIKGLLVNHYRYTLSPLAKKISDNLKQELKYFVKVMPLEYKRILEERKLARKSDSGEDADG